MHQHHYDPTLHNRRSMRLPAFDYSSHGAYFVTICTHEHQPLLEKPELCTILEDTWKTLPTRFPAVILDEFMIMSDHVHFIVWLDSDGASRPTLGGVVGAYKSLTGRALLKQMNKKRSTPLRQFWQRGYYEHVIRSEFELQQKRAYIRNNPIKEDLKSERL